MKKIRNMINSDEGFTLVEILIAMTIFAIALLGVIQVFYYAMMMNMSSKQITASANIARKEMDTVRLMSEGELDQMNAAGTKDIDVNNDGQIDYIYSWTINKAALPIGLGYQRYVITIEVQPKGLAANTRVGRDVTYRTRSVILRNSDM